MTQPEPFHTVLKTDHIGANARDVGWGNRCPALSSGRVPPPSEERLLATAACPANGSVCYDSRLRLAVGMGCEGEAGFRDPGIRGTIASWE